MKVCGLQKLTLLDYPERTACTVFTKGCNLRCPFCHNASLALGHAPEIPEEELFSFLRKRRGILEGVCVTGGEPLLQPDIEDFLFRLKGMGYLIKLDTNGTFPEKLERLLKKGLLDYVAMDIKSSFKRYSVAAGIPIDAAAIKSSIRLITEGRAEYEFRTTVVRPLVVKDDVISIARSIAGARKYYLQSFVPSEDIINCDGLSAYSKEQLEEMAAAARIFVPAAAVRGI